MLANDLVIQEDNCNLSCQYCLTGQSNFKSDHQAQLIFRPPRPSSYSCDTDLGRRLDRVMSAYDPARLPIVKVTGGEIFLVRGIVGFLRQLAERFATVVIQTNASLLTPPLIGEMVSWPNVVLQISLDALSYQGNSYRCATRAQHDHVVDRMFAAIDAGLPAEIYGVLNDRSVPWLEHTIAAFIPYRGRVALYPFPVRGPDRRRFLPTPGQIDVLRRIDADYATYDGVLPPAAYWKRLLQFLEQGARTFRCHVPRFAFTTFDDGVVTSCPNIWFDTVGNVLAEDPVRVTERMGQTAFSRLLLAEQPRLEACKACFTPWDMLSMYVDGEITLDQLCRPPSMYAAAASRTCIEQITRDYRDRHAEHRHPGVRPA